MFTLLLGACLQAIRTISYKCCSCDNPCIGWNLNFEGYLIGYTKTLQIAKLTFSNDLAQLRICYAASWKSECRTRSGFQRALIWQWMSWFEGHLCTSFMGPWVHGVAVAHFPKHVWIFSSISIPPALSLFPSSLSLSLSIYIYIFIFIGYRLCPDLQSCLNPRFDWCQLLLDTLQCCVSVWVYLHGISLSCVVFCLFPLNCVDVCFWGLLVDLYWTWIRML